jgi:hypothetical protein
MIVARCNFGPPPPHLEKDKFVDLSQSYVVCLLRNWQILGHYDLSWCSGHLWCYAPVSRRNSVDENYLSDWGKTQLAELKLQALANPALEILDDETPEEIDDWQGDNAFVLSTNFLDEMSPLVSLTRSFPVALYCLPISDQDREDAYSWAGEYETTRFLEFPFSCDSCRLVSHHPHSFDSPTRSRIGRWQPARKKE